MSIRLIDSVWDNPVDSAPGELREVSKLDSSFVSDGEITTSELATPAVADMSRVRLSMFSSIGTFAPVVVSKLEKLEVVVVEIPVEVVVSSSEPIIKEVAPILLLLSPDGSDVKTSVLNV